MAHKELLGEVLRRFKLSASPRGAEDRQALRPEGIDNARREGRFGADNGQTDAFLADKGDPLRDGGGGDILQSRFAVCTSISRCDVDLLDTL
jgi:hypothetical protein